MIYRPFLNFYKDFIHSLLKKSSLIVFNICIVINSSLFAESSIKQSFRSKRYSTLDPIVPFLLLYVQVNNDKPLLSSRRNAFAVESRYF